MESDCAAIARWQMAAMTRTVEVQETDGMGELGRELHGASEDKCHAPVRYIVKLIMRMVASTRASVPGRTSAETGGRLAGKVV